MKKGDNLISTVTQSFQKCLRTPEDYFSQLILGHNQFDTLRSGSGQKERRQTEGGSGGSISMSNMTTPNTYLPKRKPVGTGVRMSCSALSHSSIFQPTNPALLL